MKHPHDKTPQIRRLQALADVIAKRAGVKPVKIVGDFWSSQVGDEHYVPRAMANPRAREVFYNTNVHAADRPQFDDVPARHRAQIMAVAEGPTLAHEIGHTAEPQLIRNDKRGDRYMALTGQQQVRPDPAVLARAGAAQSSTFRRDGTGLPYQGSGTTHSAANESYADDFAQALGYDASTTPQRYHAMKALIQMRMLPHAKGHGLLPGALWPAGTASKRRASARG